MDLDSLRDGINAAIPFNRHALRPLVRRAEIRYLGVARGPITATATLADVDAVTAALDRDGRADVAVDVVLADGDGLEIAAMSVEWSVKAYAAPAPAA
jgi:hypothetical protein